MKTVAMVIPDHLAPHEGEELQFQALVEADGTLVMTQLLHRTSFDAAKKPKMTLREWSQKWGGTMPLAAEQSRDGFRDEYMKEKFGA